MESTGKRNLIQISEATADLLIDAGKGQWITPRQDPVEAKGKGVLNTFWLNPGNNQDHDMSSSSDRYDEIAGSGSFGQAELMMYKSLKSSRLVEWMVEMLLDQSHL